MKLPTKTELIIELSRLRAENQTLQGVAKDLHWMARRYADGRQSYATGLFNDHTRKLLALGISLNSTADNTIWARDAGGRSFDGLTDDEAALGNQPDWTWDGMQRENERLGERARELTARAEKAETELIELRESKKRLSELELALGGRRENPLPKIIKPR